MRQNRSVELNVRPWNTLNNSIPTTLDEKLNGYVICLPDFISVNAMEEWKARFDLDLPSIPMGQRVIYPSIPSGAHLNQSTV